jgi:hypothetical protein
MKNIKLLMLLTLFLSSNSFASSVYDYDAFDQIVKNIPVVDHNTEVPTYSFNVPKNRTNFYDFSDDLPKIVYDLQKCQYPVNPPSSVPIPAAFFLMVSALLSTVVFGRRRHLG